MLKNSLILTSLLLSTTPAAAHSIMDDPLPLIDDDEAKLEPCGCYFGARPNEPEDDRPSACPDDYPVEELVAGEPLRITFRETINHPGRFRIAFSESAPEDVTSDQFDDDVLYDEADNNFIDNGIIDVDITVPDSPCELCTLQLRQTMNDDPDFPHYFGCAAVRIVAGAGGDGDADADVDGDADGDADADADGDGDADDSRDRGCRVGAAPGATGGWSLGLLAFLGLGLLRRRG